MIKGLFAGNTKFSKEYYQKEIWGSFQTFFIIIVGI